MHFHFIPYGMMLYQQNSNIEKMYVYASELRNFRDLHIVKLLFPSIFLLVLQILCLRNIFNFISGVK